jgi:hypothetical protein
MMITGIVAQVSIPATSVGTTTECIATAMIGCGVTTQLHTSLSGLALATAAAIALGVVPLAMDTVDMADMAATGTADMATVALADTVSVTATAATADTAAMAATVVVAMAASTAAASEP